MMMGNDHGPCPACGGRLVEVKAKLVCERCRRIAEGCCEGAVPGDCAPARD